MDSIRINSKKEINGKDSTYSLKMEHDPKMCQAVFDSIPTAIFICDEEGKIDYCNDALCKFVNLSYKDIQFKKITEIFPSFLKKNNIFEELNKILFSGDKFSLSVNDMEDKSSGTQKDVLVIFKPVNGSKGILGHIQVSENTEQCIYNNNNELVSLLVKEISHEMGNYFTIIKSNVQYCLKHHANNTDLKESLISVIENLNLADTCTKNLLSLAKTKDQVKPNNVNNIIKKVTTILKTYISHKNIKVNLDLKSLPNLYIDDVKLEQVFVNLLLNSIHSLENRGVVLIRSLFEESTNEIIIRFTDNGKGIPPEYLEKIFDPFCTLSKNGRGLGLAICKNIVCSYAGKIYAENLRDKGAQITLHLPVQNNKLQK